MFVLISFPSLLLEGLSRFSVVKLKSAYDFLMVWSLVLGFCFLAGFAWWLLMAWLLSVWLLFVANLCLFWFLFIVPNSRSVFPKNCIVKKLTDSNALKRNKKHQHRLYKKRSNNT